MKKYEFTGETKQIELEDRIVTLHRIRAIKDFGDVKAGDLGGWIEKEENLSHESKAWVGGNAYVGGEAYVGGNAWVGDSARVHDNVYVRGKACVRGNAEILFKSHVLTIGAIGSRNDFTTFYRDKDNQISVSCGCFSGKIDEFLEKVTQTHGNSKHAQVYRAAVEVAKLQIELN